MRAGKLRHRLRIESETEARDAVGGVTRSWSTVATVWGEVRSPRGAEELRVHTVQEVGVRVIEIRYRSDVTTHHRLVHVEAGADAAIYNVKSAVDPDGRRRRLLIECTEVPDTETVSGTGSGTGSGSGSGAG